jgi:uncharacterized protein YggU (UPF0235/DUF167 family)
MRLRIEAKAGSRTPGISKNNEVVIVRVAERAVDGRANEAIRRAVAAWLDLAPSAVTIERGESSSHKSLEITGIDADALNHAVSALP